MLQKARRLLQHHNYPKDEFETEVVLEALKKEGVELGVRFTLTSALQTILHDRFKDKEMKL